MNAMPRTLIAGLLSLLGVVGAAGAQEYYDFGGGQFVRPGQWHAEANRRLHRDFDAQIRELNEWRRQSRAQLEWQRRVARQSRGAEREWRLRTIDAQWREIDRQYDNRNRQLHEQLAASARGLSQQLAAMEREQRVLRQRGAEFRPANTLIWGGGDAIPTDWNRSFSDVRADGADCPEPLPAEPAWPSGPREW